MQCYNSKMSRRDYTNLILEDINGKFDLVLEAVAPIKYLQIDVAKLKEDMIEVKADLKTIKFALKHTNIQVADHEVRIKKLETV